MPLVHVVFWQDDLAELSTPVSDSVLPWASVRIEKNSDSPKVKVIEVCARGDRAKPAF